MSTLGARFLLGVWCCGFFDNSFYSAMPIPRFYRRLLGTSLLLAGFHANAAAPAVPAPGSYGFDWMHPNKAKCTKVTEQLAAKFQSCTFQAQSGFDGNTETHSCPLAGGAEYLVFKNLKICRDQLETMKANAP